MLGVLTENDLNEFLRDGCLTSHIVTNVTCVKAIITHSYSVINLTAKEQQVYDKVIADLATRDELLQSLPGKPLAECPFEQTVQCSNGYQFKRMEYILSRHLISIKRPNVDNFYWTIGVQDADGAPNDTLITGYYSIGTNGNINDLIEAIENTKHLFPSVTEDAEHSRVLQTRSKSYIMKF